MVECYNNKRLSRRIIVVLEAELVLDNSSISGFIINLSEKGVFSMTAPLQNHSIDFSLGTALNLKFQIPSGDELNLPCIVRWSQRTHPQGLACSIGMEIIDTPLRYKEYIKTL